MFHLFIFIWKTKLEPDLTRFQRAAAMEEAKLKRETADGERR